MSNDTGNSPSNKKPKSRDRKKRTPLMGAEGEQGDTSGRASPIDGRKKGKGGGVLSPAAKKKLEAIENWLDEALNWQDADTMNCMHRMLIHHGGKPKGYVPPPKVDYPEPPRARRMPVLMARRARQKAISEERNP